MALIFMAASLFFCWNPQPGPQYNKLRDQFE
jgi:hypothetical protein